MLNKNIKAFTPATGTPTSTPVPSPGPLTIPEANNYFEFRGCNSSASNIADLKDPSVNATILNGPVDCSDDGMRITNGQWMDVTPFEFGGDFTFEIVFKMGVLGTSLPLFSFSDNLNGGVSSSFNCIYV